jgi:hypothetical protein
MGGYFSSSEVEPFKIGITIDIRKFEALQKEAKETIDHENDRLVYLEKLINHMKKEEYKSNVYEPTIKRQLDVLDDALVRLYGYGLEFKGYRNKKFDEMANAIESELHSLCAHKQSIVNLVKEYERVLVKV